MPLLDMEGLYSFSREDIRKDVAGGHIGNYALGSMNGHGGLTVEYVDRLDSDVKERLFQHIGEGYDVFKFSYALSKKAPFEKECKNCHEFGRERGNLNNEYHPDKPEGVHWRCPVCGR